MKLTHKLQIIVITIFRFGKKVLPLHRIECKKTLGL